MVGELQRIDDLVGRSSDTEVADPEVTGRTELCRLGVVVGLFVAHVGEGSPIDPPMP
jgi:hypothetical protein